ncbi:reverse transcriptase RNA-dependent DNA polymerase [Nitzschia inconspicua]|uniref:Reverse transcriptase RNA-dependent DNA polymerase n=1 Tax=Nitzschia inconspicua TaxID=303405 RepID=A0A9K3PK95_9STRA|nr:reverse transcriptase RNA-dependent DNA polymerase [Nitzschia inconspicua]
MIQQLSGGKKARSQLEFDHTETFEQEKRRAKHSEGYRSGNILSSKYDFVDVDIVVQAQRHLSADQQADLAKLLKQHSKLFSGKLGEYRSQKIHLEIDHSVKPSRSRPYTVPINHQQVFKNELDRLVRIGVLEKCGHSEWIADDESKGLTTIATPFGAYRYRQLPMDICLSPDIAQDIMENVLQGLNENIEMYIDDIGCFSNSWKSHIDLLSCVLTRLENAGCTINPIKCEWGVKETDFLGHWLTPTGYCLISGIQLDKM